MGRAAYIYGAVRTPFGRYGGALAKTRPDDLAAHSLRALLDRAPGLNPSLIDDVLLGNANGAGEDNRDVAAFYRRLDYGQEEREVMSKSFAPAALPSTLTPYFSAASKRTTVSMRSGLTLRSPSASST